MERLSGFVTREDAVEIARRAGYTFVQDLEGLRRDLDLACTFFENIKTLNANVVKYKSVIPVEKTARKLIQLLSDPAVVDRLNSDGRIDSWKRHLGEIVEATHAAAPPAKSRRPTADESRAHSELHLGQRSAFEWLVGAELPRVYEKHFGERPKFSRTVFRGGSTKLSSPYLDFCSEFLERLSITNQGNEYTAEAIVRAVTNVRSGQTRRKNKALGK